MFSRRLYRQQRGRRPLAAVAAAGLVVGMLVVTNSALAVHDEGVFQLDGNAITAGEPSATQDNPGTFSPPGDHDWSQVYQDRGGPPFPNSGAAAQAFVTDVTGAADSILTGGSTKDINDLPSWLWKQTASTSVQDKDDIEHAFAAQYSVDKTGASCGTSTTLNPCVLLYFGADRFANSGSTTMGFWFYKNRVHNLGPDAAGNGTFSGTHTARTGSGATLSHGDILIVSDFLIGGAAPTVSVFEWVDSGGSASTHLDLIGGGTATTASCTSAPPIKKNGPSVPPVSANDNLCATTNQNALTSPWSFIAKTGQAGQQVSEFMEGGINMTALGLGNECFNSFLAETRASPSPTSTLSDFALGNFGSCGATAVTTPSADTGTGAVAPGTDVTDHFVVTGTSTGGTAPYPTSAAAQGGHNVSFAYCGPIATGICDGSDTAHTAGSAFDSEALTNTAAQGVSEATSTAINTSGSPLAPGRYCFVGSWAGDNNYTDGASDNSAGECFVVRILQPSLTTAQRFVPNDSATVTVASGAGDLTGTLRFQLFVNSTTCGGTAAYDSGALDIATGTGTGLSRTLSTDNSIAYSANGTTFSWLVTYTSTNSGQNGVTAACNSENSSISIDNGGTFNTP